MTRAGFPPSLERSQRSSGIRGSPRRRTECEPPVLLPSPSRGPFYRFTRPAGRART